MTNSASSFMAIVLGLAVVAIVVAVGWRSVQNRRILRLQGSDGQETIVVAREDDDIPSLITTTETVQEAPTMGHGRRRKPERLTDAEANTAERDRLSRVVSSIKA